MVTIDDLATVLSTRLPATSGFSAAVPGGAWFDRAPDTPAAYPYLVFQVRAAPAGLTFEDSYLQTFLVHLAAYCPIGAGGVNPLTVEEVLFAAMATSAANVALQGTALRNGSERIMHAKPLAPSGQFVQQLRDGRDVFLAGLSVEVLVQGDRTVA